MQGIDAALVTSIIGVTIIETQKTYQSVAPSISSLRDAQPGSVPTAQSLLDADVYAGTIAVLVGLSSSVLMRNVVPGVLCVVSFAVISLMHHLVANAERVS